MSPPEPSDADDRILRLIERLRRQAQPGPAAQAPQPPPMPPGAGAPPLPPDLVQEYRLRIAALERELALRSQKSELQQRNREEVEEQVRGIADMLRDEKRRAALESDKARAQGRVEALEHRLDELQEKLLDLVREAMEARKKREDARDRDARDAVEAVEARLASIERSLPELVRAAQAQALGSFGEKLAASDLEIQAALERASGATLRVVRGMMLKTMRGLLEAFRGQADSALLKEDLDRRLKTLEKQWADYQRNWPLL